MSNYGTTPTQVGVILNALIKAATSVVDQCNPKDLINSFQGNGEKLAMAMRQVFYAFLSGRRLLTMPSFQVLTSVATGAYGFSTLLDKLDSAEIDIATKTRKFFFGSEFRMDAQLENLEVLVIRPVELGILESKTAAEIIDVAMHSGFGLCKFSPEAVAMLALQLNDEFALRCTYVAMDCIKDIDGDRARFYFLKEPNWPKLCLLLGKNDHHYDPMKSIFLFCRRKS